MTYFIATACTVLLSLIFINAGRLARAGKAHCESTAGALGHSRPGSRRAHSLKDEMRVSATLWPTTNRRIVGVRRRGDA